MHVVKVTPLPDDGSDKLEIDAAVAGETGIRTGDCLTLKAGALEVPVNVTVSTGKPRGQNFIAAGLLNKLFLPTDQTLNLKLVKGEPVVTIGPVIGILVSRNKRLRRPPFSRQKYLLRRFIAAGQKLGAVVYAFNPDGINRENQLIEGFFPYKNGSAEITWKKSYFPFPDVVHNRVLSRTTEKTAPVRQAVETAGDYGIKCFNPKFLNKWETHDILQQNPKICKFLPETLKYTSCEKLQHFLAKHPVVYLKPWHGSLGKDILRITKKQRICSYVHRQGKQTVSGVWQSTAEMSEALQTFVRQRSYLMQQGLDLVTYFGRVFDIRVLVQKNLTGYWEVSAVVARVGKAGSPFPNIAAGGSALAMEQVWPELFNQDWQTSPVREQISGLAFLVAGTLEHTLGNFGEMGLDVGIDTNGRVWLIEVNSKPSRKVFPQGDITLKERSIRLPMEYAVYWAGFTREQLHREQDNE